MSILVVLLIGVLHRVRPAWLHWDIIAGLSRVMRTGLLSYIKSNNHILMQPPAKSPYSGPEFLNVAGMAGSARTILFMACAKSLVKCAKKGEF